MGSSNVDFFSQTIRCRRCGNTSEVIHNQGVLPGGKPGLQTCFEVASFVYCPTGDGSAWHDILWVVDSDCTVIKNPHDNMTLSANVVDRGGNRGVREGKDEG